MKNILEVKNLTKFYLVKRHPFELKKRPLPAVVNFSLTLRQGELFGLVGESGCGKSTLGKLILLLETPDQGEIKWKGQDITKLSSRELKAWRRRCQPIFQDPLASLNPRQTVEQILEEPLVVHNLFRGKRLRQRKITRILQEVGLPAHFKKRYPHELSGGQRQRVTIARALILEPEFIVADEPTSALDVSVQAQIVNLLLDIQKSRNITYLFISHDLSLVAHIADRIGVMYMGQLVEIMARRHFQTNHHPYTECLLKAIPSFGKKPLSPVLGEPPNPLKLPPGCPYQTRCPYKKRVCSQEKPALKQITGGHLIACHLF